MSFTDDDLKRLKECVHPQSGLKIALFHSRETTMAKFDIEALLTRLEAAERAIYSMIELDDFIALGSSSDLEGHNRMVEKTMAAMDTWRRSKGDVNDRERAAGK